MGDVTALTEARRVFIDADDPATIWADTSRADDIAAMRGLVTVVMADVRRKPSWSLGWTVATTVAYHALYKPHGLHMAESDHFARVVGRQLISAADMAGLQRLYTLAHAGCSAVLAWDARQGRMVHFRSLDWPSADAIARASRLYTGTRRDGSTAFSAAGILGMVGLLTAVKPGFSVAINFAPWRGPSLSLNTDPSFLLRQLMASPITSYREAFQAIERWRPGAPVFVSLCGVERGEGCVFEFGAAWDAYGRCHAIPIGERPFLIQTNHFDAASPFARRNGAQAEAAPWGDPAWDAHTIMRTSVARRQWLEQALGEAYADSGPADMEATLHAAFARRPVWNGLSAQWVMMLPQSGGMRVWVRG